MAVLLMILMMVCSLAGFVCAIIILVAAFQEGVLQGILCLCIPFYILYFAFVRFENENKGLIIGIWLGSIVVNIVLQVVAAATISPPMPPM